MSDQASDLPRSVQMIGRYKTLIGLLALLGLLGGATFAWLNPPRSTNTALVTFAAPGCPTPGAVCGGATFSPDYIVAGLLKELPSGVRIQVMPGNVLSVSAVGGTAAQAEAAANAAARSYVAYAASLDYLGEQPSAQILQPAATATGTTPPKQVLGDALIGVVFGALVGIIAALAGSQTIIDPPTVAQGLAVGEGVWGGGRRTPYASSEVSLEQMAREYVNWRAAPDISEADLDS
jgi:hypothetical protein